MKNEILRDNWFFLKRLDWPKLRRAYDNDK